ncbi:MAG TPA: DUF305 domain-containing protein [Pilimelia sp.]|nr:DUF305 domain-containing protein [Pilimelia sp.]
MTARRRAYLIIAGLLLAAAGGGIAWGAGSPDGQPAARSTPSPSPVPVIAPGRPGESASILPPDTVAEPEGSRFNARDVTFVRMMIPHHRQAVELAGLAPTRARNPQVRAIAERIVVAQGPEIAVLQAWLADRGLTDREPGEHAAEHGHGTMRGMASPQAIKALTAARGDAFDRLFVDLMSAHHEGAIAMCGEVLSAGADEKIQELATNIAADQRIEIVRMREALG